MTRIIEEKQPLFFLPWPLMGLSTIQSNPILFCFLSLSFKYMLNAECKALLLTMVKLNNNVQFCLPILWGLRFKPRYVIFLRWEKTGNAPAHAVIPPHDVPSPSTKERKAGKTKGWECEVWLSMMGRYTSLHIVLETHRYPVAVA